MQEMIVSDHNLVTVMKEGKSIGQVSLNDMVAAIAKPKTTESGEANAYRQTCQKGDVFVITVGS